MKRALAIGLGALGCAFVTTASAQTILYNCFFPPQHYVCTEFLPEMNRRVEAATDGRVKLRIPPRTMAAPPDLFDGMVNGVMDGTMQFNGFLSHRVTGIQIPHLPFVGQEGSEAASVALWETYQKFFGELDEYGPAHLLSVWAFSGGEIFSLTDSPIQSAADIGARKMWAPPGMPAELTVATGSSVVAGPAVQMLELISRGVVDGYLGLPYAEVVQYNLLDYTRSVSVLPNKIFQPTFSFMISEEKWNTIAAEDQEAIMAALGGEFARFMGQYQDRVNREALERMREAGVEIMENPGTLLEDLQPIGAELRANWLEAAEAKGIDGEAALNFFAASYAEEAESIR